MTNLLDWIADRLYSAITRAERRANGSSALKREDALTADLAEIRAEQSRPGQEKPVFRQGAPEPPELPRHTYGKDRTLHQTGTIDIQLDPEGKVVRVWFRCLNLPFDVSSVGDTAYHNPRDSVAIEEIIYVDRS